MAPPRSPTLSPSPKATAKELAGAKTGPPLLGILPPHSLGRVRAREEQGGWVAVAGSTCRIVTSSTNKAI
jgi:hypothetical protein